MTRGPEYIISAAGDVYVLKLDNDGNFIWAVSFTGAIAGGANQSYSIRSDSVNNIYVCGIFIGLVDFDPGPSTFYLNANQGHANAFIVKLNETGSLVWAKQAVSSLFNFPYAIALDRAGNIYMSGWFSGSVDFDPGPGTENQTSAAYSAYVWKLNNNGSFGWVRIASAQSLPMLAYDISADQFGNTYSIGQFKGSADFGPGPGTTVFSSSGESDIFIWKLKADGSFAWAKTMGAADADEGEGIWVDKFNDIYTTGLFADNVDFDPETPVIHCTAQTKEHLFKSSLNAVIQHMRSSLLQYAALTLLTGRYIIQRVRITRF